MGGNDRAADRQAQAQAARLGGVERIEDLASPLAAFTSVLVRLMSL
jgi:hypothetical protein